MRLPVDEPCRTRSLRPSRTQTKLTVFYQEQAQGGRGIDGAGMARARVVGAPWGFAWGQFLQDQNRWGGVLRHDCGSMRDLSPGGGWRGIFGMTLPVADKLKWARSREKHAPRGEKS